ncbi:MAG: hypothetical protein A2073_03165 [Deltaproteobacteria bacterium GWC2_42_11]|nr:MAG: hypothetical protein A2073_03165 [Deltaproteobacteria bacterium GWC2_42_11]HBO84222.1 hypothetical protein [Deltaproteobacteria bacterium]
MKEKIITIQRGKEGVIIPGDYMRYLELIPGSDVEVYLDKKRKWIVIRPMHGEDFVEHFKSTMDSMA